MTEILGIFALLVCASMLAGYVPVRLLAAWWPRSSRLALQPLLGAGLIAVTLAWVHYFTPLRSGPVLFGFVPIVAGAAALGRDIVAGRLRRRPRVAYVWPILSMAAAILVLAPFFVLGSATSFGLYSNDAFWWTAADWRVQQHAFNVPDEQVTSPLARVAIPLKRYGFNYLSVLVQSVTGFRSWQVVHLNGAFGLFLVMQAAWLLARRTRTWWVAALLIAIATAANHFSYRVFLDGVLAFQFGFAYFLATVAVIAGPVPPAHRARCGVILGITGASLGVFYADMIPVTGIACGTVAAGLAAQRRLTRHHVRAAAIGSGISLLALIPLLVALPGFVRAVAANSPPGPHYRLNDVLHTWMHLAGAADLWQYLHRLDHRPLQFAGAAAVSVLAVRTVMSYAISRRLLLTFGPVLAMFACLWGYLMSRGLEYTAHRVMVVSSPFVITLLAGWLRPTKPTKHSQQKRKRSKAASAVTAAPIATRAWATVAAVAFAANLYPAYRMIGYLRTNYIAVTPEERQIGDEWIPRWVPPGAKVTIDAEEDLFLFYPHYMYAEALHGLRKDESRIVLPRTFYTFVEGSAVEQFNPAQTEFVLRRKGIGRILGSFRTVASNNRYELLVPVDRSSLVLIWFRDGFYQLERNAEHQWRWLNDGGRVTAVSGKMQTVELTSVVEANPAIGATSLHIWVNGAEIQQVPVVSKGYLQLKIPLRTGNNELVFDSSTPPAPLPSDLRLISLRLLDQKLTLALPST